MLTCIAIMWLLDTIIWMLLCLAVIYEESDDIIRNIVLKEITHTALLTGFVVSISIVLSFIVIWGIEYAS